MSPAAPGSTTGPGRAASRGRRGLRRAVDLHVRYAPDDPVEVELSDDGTGSPSRSPTAGRPPVRRSTTSPAASWTTRGSTDEDDVDPDVSLALLAGLVDEVQVTAHPAGTTVTCAGRSRRASPARSSRRWTRPPDRPCGPSPREARPHLVMLRPLPARERSPLARCAAGTAAPGPAPPAGPGGRMSALHLALDGDTASLAGGDKGLVVGVLGLPRRPRLRRCVRQGGPGRRPGHAQDDRDRQGGPGGRRRVPAPAVHDARRLRGPVFLLLFLLPAETAGVRIGRSLFFLFGAASPRSSASSA